MLRRIVSTVFPAVMLSFASLLHGNARAQDPAIAGSSNDGPEQESRTYLQHLPLTVTRGGLRVHDLQKEDFSIFDNKVRQEIVTFQTGDAPIATVLLLDVSKSVEEHLEMIRIGVRSFLNGMSPLDETALITFSDRVSIIVPFAREKSELLAALQEGTPDGGGTAINDHLYAALEILHYRENRRIVLLVSDGLDIESMLSMDDVLWKARRGNVLIYWIMVRESGLVTEKVPLGVRYYSSWRDNKRHQQEISKLKSAVKESGGRVVVVSRPEELKSAFADILGELRGQYILGYVPDPRAQSGQWRSVKVRVRMKGAKVRTKSGYVEE